MIEVINNVKVEYDPEIAYQQVVDTVHEEIQLWEKKKKRLTRIKLTVEGNEVIVEAFEKSPIRRIRRICGYCSNTANWGQHKLDELAQRKAHV